MHDTAEKEINGVHCKARIYICLEWKTDIRMTQFEGLFLPKPRGDCLLSCLAHIDETAG